MTMMTRACAIGFLAILTVARAANAQIADQPKTLTRSPPKQLAVHISNEKSARIVYAQGSSLVNLSPFIREIGALDVRPTTLPHRTFRAFDLRGRPSGTIYMHARRWPKRAAVHISDRKKSERLGYEKVSSLVDFPPFFPGIGALYVQPKTLPNGPYRAFDRRGRLSSTIYMLPIEDLENRKRFDLEGLAGKGDHVTFYFNSGHPGLDKPHYHIHIWHVSKKGEEQVAK
ncbi:MULTISPECIES: hypothetical protein [Bradyrhizobium]|uniref:hypothetical protein n=1 Tax=Bradyrhizobium elkanii TaxID=29448 RepID=UPI0012BBF292|nr:hypothetical protein [Bradyrhizobium elkanii]